MTIRSQGSGRARARDRWSARFIGLRQDGRANSGELGEAPIERDYLQAGGRRKGGEVCVVPNMSGKRGPLGERAPVRFQTGRLRGESDSDVSQKGVVRGPSGVQRQRVQSHRLLV